MCLPSMLVSARGAMQGYCVELLAGCRYHRSLKATIGVSASLARCRGHYRSVGPGRQLGRKRQSCYMSCDIAPTRPTTTGDAMPQRVLPAFLLLALLLLAPAQVAHAQAGGMPSEIEGKLTELGAVVNVPDTAKLYAPLQETEPYQGVKVTRDLKYGTDERQALDIFAPEQA